MLKVTGIKNGFDFLELGTFSPISKSTGSFITFNPLINYFWVGIQLNVRECNLLNKEDTLLFDVNTVFSYAKLPKLENVEDIRIVFVLVEKDFIGEYSKKGAFIMPAVEEGNEDPKLGIEYKFVEINPRAN